MKINTKNYPKTIVYRKWMVVIAGLVLALVMILFMYNVSHQSAKKAIKKQENADAPKQTMLASNQDMDWIGKGRIDKGTAPIVPPVSTQLAAMPEISTSLPPSLLSSDTQTTQNINPGSTNNSPADESVDEAYQKRQDEKQKAMMAPITANQLLGASDNTQGSAAAQTGRDLKSSSMGNAGVSSDDPNGQTSKEAFVDKAKNSEEGVYLDKGVISPRSPYELQAGTIIPGILITGINSDLPGQIVGQIRQNVRDSVTGDHILIPQGAKVVGLYDSKVTYGQERVLVVWKRIIYPNGDSIDLSGMPGVDLSGYAGFNDEVNNHFRKIFGSILLLSTMSAGAQLSQLQNNNNLDNNYPTVGQTMAQSLGTNISDFGTQLANKNLNIQPTLVIRPGYLFYIAVTKDIVFPGPYNEAY
jgi:type IV secretory pathway VirB10-like protein